MYRNNNLFIFHSPEVLYFFLLKTSTTTLGYNKDKISLCAKVALEKCSLYYDW